MASILESWRKETTLRGFTPHEPKNLAPTVPMESRIRAARPRAYDRTGNLLPTPLRCVQLARCESQESRSPSGLLASELRNHYVLAVSNLSGIRSGVVTSLKYSLKIDCDGRITRKKRNCNRRETILEPNGVHKKGFEIIKIMDRGMVIKRSACIGN